MATYTTDSAISYETWRAIDARLTFRPRDLIHTIGVLTMYHFGPPGPHNPAVYDLSAMVKELQDNGIVGYERTKSWLSWYSETAHSVFRCFAKSPVKDARDGWNWMVRPWGEFRYVAGALYEMLAEDFGFVAKSD